MRGIITKLTRRMSQQEAIALIAELMRRRPSTVQGWIYGREPSRDTIDLLTIRLKDAGYI